MVSRAKLQSSFPRPLKGYKGYPATLSYNEASECAPTNTANSRPDEDKSRADDALPISANPWQESRSGSGNSLHFDKMFFGSGANCLKPRGAGGLDCLLQA